MEQAVADWLISVIPPEAGPSISWAAANYNVARPMMIAGFTAIVLLEALIVIAIYRAMTR